MARLSTCKGCGEKLLPEEKHTHNSKTYCEECFKSINRESTEYKQLIDFICVNYEIDVPTGFMFKQIKELRNDFNYPYSAMTYTLWYCKEILNKEFIEKYGVALIKHYYNEAKDYYLQQERVKEQMLKIADVDIKTRIIKHHKFDDDKNRPNSLINLQNILNGGDKN